MQAARGTSLSSDSDDPKTPSTSTGMRFRFLFAGVALVLYGVDLTAKELALRHLDGAGRIDLVGDLLGLRLAFNPGAAFSLGTDFTVVISVIAIAATIAVLWFSRRLGSGLWAVALGVLFAGITGNLTDRLFRDPSPFHGHVVDMIQLPNFPIFNVADMCINVAAVLIVVQTFRGIRIDGTPIEDETSETSKASEEAGEAEGGAGSDDGVVA